MGVSERREMIRERIARHGEVNYVSLARAFDVSEMTIRRDMYALELTGAVRRVVGGAISVAGKAAEPSFAARAREAASGKAHIAGCAAKLLRPGAAIILDSGSTVLALAREIKGRGLGLTVVTPSLLVALELADEVGTEVFIVGGKVRPGEMSLIGSETEDAFQNFNCDIYFMGVGGVDAVHGVSDYHREEASVKRAAVAAADRIVLLVDNDKLGRVQLSNIARLSEIDVVVTDGEENHPVLVAARDMGVEVLCVPPE